MQIALFGATGGTGRQVLDQALASGHTVTALVRDPARIEARSGLSVLCGDVLDQEATSRCIQGSAAVICVLGSGVGTAPVEAQGTQRILDAMKSNGVRRLVAVTSLGVGDSREHLPDWARKKGDEGLRDYWQQKNQLSIDGIPNRIAELHSTPTRT
jgi:putative NADH-flavin reductase